MAITVHFEEVTGLLQFILADIIFNVKELVVEGSIIFLDILSV